MATIHDVAALAGVSVSSVSNVLNQRADKLGADTFARVEAAILKLNYRPNRVARQLKTGHTPMLGLLVPSTANPMYGQIALKIEAAAQAQFSYRLLLGNTHRDKQQEAGMFDDLLSFGVRSVIVVSSRDDERHLEAAVQSGLTVVSYDRQTTVGADSQVDHISPDNFQAGYVAAAHLIEHGHRRLAFLVPSGKTVSRSAKIQGFFERAQQAGPQVSAEVIEGIVAYTFGDSELADLGFAMAGKLADMKPRPTGVVTVNDMLAMGLMSGLHQAGLRVPEDISLVGMDGLSIAAFTNPGLTSVAMPLTEMAEVMVRRAVERSRDRQQPALNLVFQPTLISRHSVAPPGADKRA
ncbi:MULTISPECIES: LacI family DNA-binding transcriptional regulator [Pseudomonas syringae group]|jgi:DNA-binding LacI/PurR family transcriptional regulator|uniref:LacI family DNA-binding transcriptional regulator n=1 Tax=Pseudomonas TaxID=286 RepID=UPI000CCFFFE1|nr:MULTISPECIES: LacI family DNA-binding transcriptional regulator [Pseudomonas syringae group]MCF5031025.1 substrate-binding domain-containing protein [Pseudomonas syringae]MCF8976621.1 substrate-binding domain-containing protein [Pseudomonas syringae]MCJ8175127.1 LacI family DNA-binding transcriptional regulator [Pseudomonas viridiflava]POD18414.1 LacI family transcriptional regulator [Pseudomonas syringae pv. syringae]UQB20200.1 LacI family DNA-binding transcriptional regulator [Pseudomonas